MIAAACSRATSTGPTSAASCSTPSATCRASWRGTPCPPTRAAAVPLLQDCSRRATARWWPATPTASCASRRLRATTAISSAALDALGARAEWRGAVARDRRRCCALYEDVFRHRAYTGRSGAMYGYEGLGCIYWHMVAKLLLAVQETSLRAEREGSPRAGAGRPRRGLLPDPRRARLREDGRRVRRLPHRPLLAHPGRRRRQAAGHDRPGEGGDPHPVRASWACGSRTGRCASGRSSWPSDEFLSGARASTTYDVARDATRACTWTPAPWPSRSARCRWSTTRARGRPGSGIVFADGAVASSAGDAPVRAHLAADLFARSGRSTDPAWTCRSRTPTGPLAGPPPAGGWHERPGHGSDSSAHPGLALVLPSP